MSLIEVTGDLFATPDLDVLAQGVNCIGAMGAGIAVTFRELWPEMFSAYQHRCASGLLPLGGFMAWRIPEGARDRLPARLQPRWQYQPKWIYNLATQPRPGPCASLQAIKSSLDYMLSCARGMKFRRIGMPKIGCGHGGLRWEDVRPLIEAAAKYQDIVVVDKRPAPKPQLRVVV